MSAIATKSSARIIFVFLLAAFVLFGCSDDGVAGGEYNQGGQFDVAEQDVDDGTDDPDTSQVDDADLGGDDDGSTNGSDDSGSDDSGSENAGTIHEYYEYGSLTVSTTNISESPADIIVWQPQGSDDYPIVVFQHGFLMANSHYSQLLEHVASHGFVVVAPQMYPADGIPLGKPSTFEEAELANELYDWIETDLAGHIDSGVDVDSFGLAGHSRGGKVIWAALDDQPRSVGAVAGVDPVDGTGGPLGSEPRILDDPPTIDAPILNIGTGLGSESVGTWAPACAPEEDNYEHFHDASSSPAWQVVAPDYGHNDVLDDDPTGCGQECDACVDGDSREPMRTLSAGLLVALFRGALHDESAAFDVMEDEAGAPVTITVDVK